MIEKAKWIWIDEKEKVNRYVSFLREFGLTEKDNSAKLEISADTNYALWLNDEFVDCGQYFDVGNNKSYDTLDVSKYLKTGKNKLYIEVYYEGESNFTYKKGISGLCFALKCGKNLVLSDENVLSREIKGYEMGNGVQKTTFQLGYGFNFDANQENDEYKKSVVAEKKVSFKERPIEKLCLTKINDTKIVQQGYCLRKNNDGETAEKMYSDYLSFTKFDKLFKGNKEFSSEFIGEKRKDEGIYIIVDLKKEASGYLTFDIDTNKGCNVEIAYGEHLVDGRVRSYVGGRFFANKYVAKDGKQKFTYYAKRMAMRYIEIHFWNFEKLILNDVSVISSDYPLPEAKKLDIPDELHKKIYETSINTLKLCMHEHYEDCPWREQALYGSDSRNAALCTYYAFDEYSFARASLDLFLSEVMDNGYFRICAPCDVDLFIPSFGFIALFALSEYTEYSGDLTLAKEHWDTIKAMLDKSLNTKENETVCPPKDKNAWIFYEWADDWFDFERKIEEKTKIDGLHILFLCLAIESTINVAKKIDDIEFVNKYRSILDRLKEMFDKTFWDSEKKLYSSFVSDGELVRFDELTQSLSVLLDIADEKKRESILKTLANDNDLVEITLGYSIYKYEALLKDEKYKEIVLHNIAEKWGRMLFEGATSFWETKDGAAAFDDAGSLCHAWSATPIIVYNKIFNVKEG